MDGGDKRLIAGGLIAVVILLLLFRRLKSTQELLQEAQQPIYHIDGPVINQYQLPGIPDIIFPPFAGGDTINFVLPDLGGDAIYWSKIFGSAFDWMQTTDLACACSYTAYQPTVWINVQQPPPPPVTQYVYVSPPPVLPPRLVEPTPALTTYPRLTFGKVNGGLG